MKPGAKLERMAELLNRHWGELKQEKQGRPLGTGKVGKVEGGKVEGWKVEG